MNREPGRFHSWRLRLGLSLLCAIPILILAVTIDYQLRQITIHSNLIHLQQTVDTLRNTIRQQFDFAVQTSVWRETHRDDRLRVQIDQLHQFLSSLMVVSTERSATREQTQQSFVAMINTMNDDNSGQFIDGKYIIVDSSGKVILHPDFPSGTDISEYPFFREMLTQEKTSETIRCLKRIMTDDPETEEIIAFRIFKPWNWVVGIHFKEPHGAWSLLDRETPENPTRDVSDMFSTAWLTDLVHSIQPSKSGFALIQMENGRGVSGSSESEFSLKSSSGFLEQLGSDAGIDHCFDSRRQKWWIATLHFTPMRWIIRVASPESDFLIPYYEKQPIIYTLLTVSYLLLLILIYLFTHQLMIK